MDKKDAYEWIPYPEQYPNYKFYICKSYDGKTNTTFDTPGDSFRIEFEYEYTGVSIYGNRDARSNGVLYSRLSRGALYPGEPVGVVGFLGYTYQSKKSVRLICGVGSINPPYTVVQDTTQSTYTNSGTYYYDDRGSVTNYDYGGTATSFIEYPPLKVSIELENYWTTNETYISCNFPIFETEEQARNYIYGGGESLEGCINIVGSESDLTENTKEYYIYNRYEEVSINKGIVTVTDNIVHQLNERILYNGHDICLYRTASNPFILSLKTGDGVVGSYFSDTETITNIPYDEFSDDLEYSSPFYSTYNRKLEIFSYDGYMGIGLLTNIPIFGNETNADDYLAGNIGVNDAENFDKLSTDPAWSGYIKSTVGTEEDETEFGQNGSRNVFSCDYIMGRSALVDIAGNFFDTSIVDALLEGLKLYGNDPMNAVMGCIYFPFDLTDVCSTSSVSRIAFGSYSISVSGVNKVLFRNGIKELGQTFIKPTFHSWLDYKATHIYVFLPYVGFQELDINKYMNKMLKITYIIDIHSGECAVNLLADNVLMDTYSGQIGIKQPLSWNDLSTYFQSQITALRNGVMTSLGMPVAGGTSGAMTGGSVGGPYGAVAGAAIGTVAGSAGSTANAMWTGYKFGSTRPPLFSKGGYSSEVGANMPQYAFLVFMYNDVEVPENELQIVGKPSNKSGVVANFSGFLSCNYVQLQCSGATEAEKNEIQALLTTGIYI